MARNSLEAHLASLPGVHAAVRARRDVIAAQAKALFAPHDNPGGHRITKTLARYDGYVWLEGEVPGAVEFGHFTEDGTRFVPGLHVIGRAAR